MAKIDMAVVSAMTLVAAQCVEVVEAMGSFSPKPPRAHQTNLQVMEPRPLLEALLLCPPPLSPQPPP